MKAVVPITPLIYGLIFALSLSLNAGEQDWSKLNQQAFELYELGEIAEAIDLGTKALDLFIKSENSNSTDHAILPITSFSFTQNREVLNMRKASIIAL